MRFAAMISMGYGTSHSKWYHSHQNQRGDPLQSHHQQPQAAPELILGTAIGYRYRIMMMSPKPQKAIGIVANWTMIFVKCFKCSLSVL